MVLLGQPWQAPWKRIWTTPSSLTATSSMSPPSACTAGRIRLITPCTRSATDVAADVAGAVEFAAASWVRGGIGRIIDANDGSNNRTDERARNCNSNGTAVAVAIAAGQRTCGLS